MKIGIFGGTFDPPHIGHIQTCQLFLNEFNLDRLFVIPTYLPPHKEIKSKTTTKQRFEMSEIAFSGLSDKIIVSDIEIKRQGKSYTADTIKEFVNMGYDDIYLLCGTDMILTLSAWYKPEYIFEHASIVYTRRENDEENSTLILEKIKEYEDKFSAKIFKLNTSVIEISSSEIREDIDNELTRKFLSKEIKSYIIDNGLYRWDYYV